jgi:recombinational DNA repair ATPase RecF
MVTEIFCVKCFENDTLSIYNEQLTIYGKYIFFEKRKKFIEQFILLLTKACQAITGSEETDWFTKPFTRKKIY